MYMEKLIVIATCILCLTGWNNETQAQLVYIEDNCSAAEISLYTLDNNMSHLNIDATLFWVDSVAKSRVDKFDGRWMVITNKAYADIVACYTQYPWEANFLVNETRNIARSTVRNDALTRYIESNYD